MGAFTFLPASQFLILNATVCSPSYIWSGVSCSGCAAAGTANVSNAARSHPIRRGLPAGQRLTRLSQPTERSRVPSPSASAAAISRSENWTADRPRRPPGHPRSPRPDRLAASVRRSTRLGRATRSVRSCLPTHPDAGDAASRTNRLPTFTSVTTTSVNSRTPHHEGSVESLNPNLDHRLRGHN